MPLAEQAVTDLLSRYDKFVIWGLRRKLHSHRYIHEHFYTTLRKLNRPVVWVEDSAANNEAIGANDLVLTVDAASKHLDVSRPAFYVLHNVEAAIVDRIPPERRLSLQVYTKAMENLTGLKRWGAVTAFDPTSRTLYQPWGTNLLAREFLAPVPPRVRSRTFMFWVGSVWNNHLDQGNVREIAALIESLRTHGKKFVKVRFIPNWMNTALVRQSFLAPAIAGRWQVENDYLPCRMFKNISYGHIGLTNVPGFDRILGDAAVGSHDVAEMIDVGLALGEKQFIDLVRAQQTSIVEHTYDQKLACIARALAS